MNLSVCKIVISVARSYCEVSSSAIRTVIKNRMCALIQVRILHPLESKCSFRLQYGRYPGGVRSA
jgi:hypothetical protein